MDLASLVTMCSIAFDRGMMQSLIWEETQAHPWSYQLSTHAKSHTYSTLSEVIAAARKAQPNNGTIRVGLTGLEVDLNTATAQPNEAMFASCPNITIASERLHALEERCSGKPEFKSNPTACAIAAWHGTFENPDWKFADAVMIGAVTGSMPNPELPIEFGEAADGSDRAPPVGDEDEGAPSSSPLLHAIQASDDERRQREFERAGGPLFASRSTAGDGPRGAKSSTQLPAHGSGASSTPAQANDLFVATGRKQGAQ